MINDINIPVKEVGPIKIIGEFSDEVSVPLATYEKPLWPSVGRGAKVSQKTDGIKVCVVDERMTRSVVLQAESADELVKLRDDIIKNKTVLQKEVEKTSKFAQLIDMHFQIVGSLIYIRFEFLTGDASGHNMATKAADALIGWIGRQNPKVKYVSISGNYCTDKKVSAVNGILGRGKNITTEIIVPKNICEEILKTSPEKIVNLNIKKNLIGSILAGSLRSANAHYANMLLAIYLATGQDAANIIEGSQGITYAEVKEDGSLYFSVNCPNIIVGTVGNGKSYPFVEEYLEKMGCSKKDVKCGENSRRLACIMAATVLCGELSLIAAQTNQGELMAAHEKIERNKK